MTRASNVLIWLLFALLLSLPHSAKAQTTINAATCSSTDIQNALNNVAADNTTVVLPVCNVSWSSTVTYNQIYSTIIKGQGDPTGSDSLGNPTGYNDQTVIFDLVPNSSNQTFVINTAAGKSFRMTGVSFLFTSSQTVSRNNGVIGVNGNSHTVRIDHNHFIGGICCRMVNVGGANVWGAMDHNLFDEQNGTNVNLIEVNGNNWNGFGDPNGDQSWADLSYFGSNKFLFIENNTIQATGTSGIGSNMDIQAGARAVFRYNTILNVALQTHGIGHNARDRGPRAWEVYKNNFTHPGFGGYFAVTDYEGGTSLYWGNTIGTGYSSNFIRQDYRRASGDTYTQAAPPNGWGYCGTLHGPSVWDQNADSTGQACLDGTGRGKGNLLAGNSFPSVTDQVTGTQAWPNQASDPVYVWSNTFGGSTYFGVSDPATAKNRDFYTELPNVNDSSTFNGTGGIGHGLVSAKPATCTPFVGWWATDQNTLYQCSATNTWTSYYTPYAYPHPLVNSITWGNMDEWLQMNTSTPGTVLTQAILAAGSVGAPALSSWTLVDKNSTVSSTPDFTVAASQGTMGGSITVNGTTYPDGTPTQSFALNNSVNYTYARTGSVSGSQKQVVCNGYITFGWANLPTGNNIDLIWLNDTISTGAVVLQLNNQNKFVVHIETNGVSGFIGRSPDITLTPGHRYSFSLLFDEISGIAKLSMFDPSNNFAQVGSTVTQAQNTGSTFTSWIFGNGEIGLSTGTTSYFENLMLDWTNHVFPNAPHLLTSGTLAPPTGLSAVVQ